LPQGVYSEAAQEQLNSSQAILGGMGYGERLAVRDTALEILVVDGRIKQATEPKNLERWRNIEGALTAELFLNSVPLAEKFDCERFDEFAEYARKFFAFGNNMDSLADFKTDSGKNHQVEATFRNRAIYAVRSLGSLAAVMKMRGPLRNPYATGRALMNTSGAIK